MAEVSFESVFGDGETVYLGPCHPGEILLEEFIEPHGLTPYRVAKMLGVGRSSLSKLINGQASITPLLAALLGECFGTSPGMWSNLQASYDEARLAQDEKILARIKAVKKVQSPPAYSGSNPVQSKRVAT